MPQKTKGGLLPTRQPQNNTSDARVEAHSLQECRLNSNGMNSIWIREYSGMLEFEKEE